jgi:hypothetical protein
MSRRALRIFTAALVLIAVPHGAFAQAGRAGGGAAAPVGGIPLAPAAPAVVPHVAPPPMAAPVIVPHVPPVVAPAVRPLALPPVHAPSVGAAPIPQSPRSSAPVGRAGVHSGIIGPASPGPTSVTGPAVRGATSHSPGGHRLRHRRERGVNPALLWDDPGSRATCGWYWLRRPGHRRLHLYRCS